jgi:hypothetical protein
MPDFRADSFYLKKLSFFTFFGVTGSKNKKLLNARSYPPTVAHPTSACID